MNFTPGKYLLKSWNWFFILVITTFTMRPVSVHAESPQDLPLHAFPRMYVGLDERITAEFWTLGSTLTLTVDNNDNFSDGYLFRVSQEVDSPTDDVPELGATTFKLWHTDSSWDILPGQFVTITDNVTTKTIEVKPVTFDYVNPETGLAVGTGPANRNIEVTVRTNVGQHSLHNIVIGQDETWVADFGADGFGLNNVQWATVDVWDDDGDSIVARLPYEITFGVRPETDTIEGWEWPVHELVTIAVDDPNTTDINPDKTDTIMPTWVEGDPGHTLFTLGFEDYDVKTGDIVTVSNGTTTKEHTVRNLTLTTIDLDNHILSGTANSGELVYPLACWQDNCAFREETTDQDGNWSANFQIPGDKDWEQDTIQIQPGSWVDSTVRDEDGDVTQAGRQVTNPTFAAFVNAEFIEGYQWPLDAIVALEIDDPATGANPDYTDSTTVAAADWDPSQTWLNFEIDSYDLKTGDMVKLSSDGIVKQLTVVNLTITEVDFLADVVYGTADPDQAVSVGVCTDFCIFRDVTADSSGDWSANFAVPSPGNGPEDTIDIQGGIWINALIWDDDGDNTSFGLTAEIPQCQPGDSVSGIVFEHDGITPIANASIQVENFTTGESLFTTLTGQNGQFGCSLPGGDYRILARADNHSKEYFDQAHDTNAVLLHVTSGMEFPNINFTLSRLPLMEHLTFNLDNPILQDFNVRKAIFLGTDRQTILNEAFLPHNIFGVVSNSIVPPEHWAEAPASELTLYPYNPTQAGAILDAAGWINRDGDIYRENASGVELAFSLKTTGAQVRVEAAEIFRQNMEQIGIRITVEHIPPGELFDDNGPLAQGNFDIAEFAWGDNYDDETYLEAYITDHVDNMSGYSNALYDAAMANAAAASTEAEKLTYYYEAQAILSQDLPIIPYFTRQNVAPVTTPAGSNVTVSPEPFLDISFGEVTDGGVTTVLPLDINPDDLPPNFQVLGRVYDIGTSASFTSAQVCFSYDDAGLIPSQEESIQLLHLEDGTWVDVTDAGYPDTINNVVCGTVASFSPFTIVYSTDSTPPGITWIGTIEDDDTYYYGFVPPAPTCTAIDGESGVNGGCMVTGYGSFIGQHTLTATASDNAGNTTIETRSYTVLSWTLNGFHQPVDTNGVYNLVKNGSTVPLKFEIFAGDTELTDPALILRLTYAQTSCNSAAITDEIETTVTGGTSLRYDESSGQFIYNWKTPRTSGTCYRLTLTTMDGSTLAAYFKLK